MTCSDADENCPVVFGADARFPVRYDDPKQFDGTELEEEKYDERVEQIGREMLYVFSLLKS
jgi:arsenate reductase